MCTHNWVRMLEEFILGGHFPIGYQCENCGLFVSLDKVPPTGLGGTNAEKDKLIGVHGSRIQRSNGEFCKSQTYDRKNNVLIIEK